MEFRKRVVEDFAIVFNGSESGSNKSNDSGFAEKWGWFGVMYRLTNGEIINLERITKLSLFECLTWLSYETDLAETKNVTTNYDTQ